MNGSTLYVAFLFLILITAIATGCMTDTSDKNRVGNTEIIRPVDYGNGVLYFPCQESKFANSLSDYLSSNPSMRVDAITGDGNGYHGSDDGYYVVVEKR